MSENDLDLVRRGLLTESRVGWQDYNDLGTKTTPVTLSVADTWYDLPNDGLGPYTKKDENVVYKGDLWDTSTGTFDFSDLHVGDLVFIRLTGYITTTVSNVAVAGRLMMAQGSGIDYPISFDQSFIKKAGRHLLSPMIMLYIGNEETRAFPAKPQAMSDTAGTTVEVDGWVITVFTRD